MLATHVTITCNNCNARLKVKPGLLKVMNVIKCSKCRHPIKVSEAAVEAPEDPVEQEMPVQAASAKPVEKPKTPTPNARNSALLDINVQPVENDGVTDQPAVSKPDLVAAYKEEIETLTIQLRAAQQEVNELDERVASLQQLYQSKEVEVRDMASRVAQAETAAKEAIRVRDDFLANIKQEIGLYLVEERDAALKRFSELESRLMSLAPGK